MAPRPSAKATPGPAADAQAADTQPPQISSLLGSMWHKYLPLMRERLAALDAASDALAEGALSPEQRELAIDAAHKFAGSLGMFGFPAGTDAARSLEHLLMGPAPYDQQRVQLLVADLHRILHL